MPLLRWPAVRTWILQDYLRKWVVLGSLIGVVAGIGAIIFFVAIDVATDFFLGALVGFDPPAPRGEAATLYESAARPWLLPVVLGLGGLVSGLIVFFLAPEAEGHGTDAAIQAFHERGGWIRPRIPPIKLLASAITIGSGGSAGREGPTAQIAAGFGSWLGDVFQLTAEDRRIALAAGMGAGIGAIFKAPLGGALLSAEILYLRDFEIAALIPGFIASVIGYCIFAAWSGWTPVFGSDLAYEFTDPASLPWFALLGLCAGLAGMAYVRTFYGVRDQFHRIPLPPHVKPAIGALIVGIIGIRFPEILSMGYGWIQFAIEDNRTNLALGTLLLLVPLKIVATSLTIGSGGSGGVFAPGLFIGGMLGGALWGVLNGHAPGLPGAPEPFVVVGMGALFGGISKAPIAVMLMVAEMTGEFSMIVPAMAAISISYLISGDTTIYTSQVATRGNSPAHRGAYTIPLLQAITVGQSMDSAVHRLEAGQSVTTAIDRLDEEGVPMLPVVDAAGRLTGVFSAEDALRARDRLATPVGSVVGSPPAVAYATDSLYQALERMTRTRMSALPVVEEADRGKLVGYLSMATVSRALEQHVSELRERPEAIRSSFDDPLRYVLVDEVMSDRVECLVAGTPLPDAVARLTDSGLHAAILLGRDGNLDGLVTVTDLESAVTRAAADEDISTYATRPVIVARPKQTVAEVLRQPGAEGLRQFPVVRGPDEVVGMLRRQDIVAAYLQGRTRISTVPTNPNGVRSEVVSTEVAVERLARANGRTLSEIGLPRGVVVIGVYREDTLLIPRGGLRLLTGDRVQLIGSPGDLPSALQLLTG